MATLVEIEAAYCSARDARDAADVARALGEPADLDGLEAAALRRAATARALLEAFPRDAEARLTPDDRRALDAMREGIADADPPHPAAVGAQPPPVTDRHAWRALVRGGGSALRIAVERSFASAAEALPAPGGPASRITILARLAAEPDTARRRELFLAFEPLWRLVDGDGGEWSPYRRMVADAVPAWRAGAGSLTRNAAALGIPRESVEAWALTTLSAWRAAVVEPARAVGDPGIEPWDWWWEAGAAERAVGTLPSAAIRDINRDVHAAYGADLDELGIRVDTASRPGRPPVIHADAMFGSRPRQLADGTWSSARPVVLGALDDGGLDELSEVLHITGHAIHMAGIRTRPAFTDLPDADALNEGLADLLAFDVAESAWQRRWLPRGVAAPETLSLRCHYAAVVLDAAWAVFELRLLADPTQRPAELWTHITSVWLGIVPHPEWSWWAIRGQLVRELGYMANYPLGTVLTTEFRAAIREQRGDPGNGGDPGWYPWVRDRILRFGRERPSGQVVLDVLGRAPSADALLDQIARAAPPPRVH